MRKIVLFIVALLWSQLTLAQLYVQKVFVFSSPRVVEGADAEQECAEGIDWLTNNTKIRGINPTYFSKTELSVVETLESNARVTSTDVNNIGELLICQDYQSCWPDRNLVPRYFEITINNRKYRAVGGGTSEAIPQLDTLPGGTEWMTPADFPTRGVNYINYTGTVLPARRPGRGGTIILTNLGFVDGVPKAAYDHARVGVLSIVQPIQP